MHTEDDSALKVAWQITFRELVAYKTVAYKNSVYAFTCTVMQIEKALINHRLRVSKVSWKFHVQTICNFAGIFPWNLLLSYKVAYFLTVSIVFSFYKQNFTAQ